MPEADVAILPTRPALMVGDGVADAFGSGDEFTGRNPGNAVDIVYWLKKRHIFGDMRVEIYDADGEMLIDLGEPETALGMFELALERAPRRTLSLAGLATVSSELGRARDLAEACGELEAIWTEADAGIVRPEVCDE